VDVWDGVPQDDILYTMDQGAVVGVYLKEDASPDATLEALRERAQQVTVYPANEIPTHLNYSRSPDRPDILIVANPGIQISHFKNP